MNIWNFTAIIREGISLFFLDRYPAAVVFGLELLLLLQLLLSLLIGSYLSLSLLVVDVVLIVEDLLQQVFFRTIPHFLQYLLPWPQDNEISKFPPNRVISLVREARNLGNLLPGVIVLLHCIQQPRLQWRSPQVFTNARVYDIAVPLSNLKLAFHLHLLCYLRPFLESIVL